MAEKPGPQGQADAESPSPEAPSPREEGGAPRSARPEAEVRVGQHMSYWARRMRKYDPPESPDPEPGDDD